MKQLFLWPELLLFTGCDEVCPVCVLLHQVLANLHMKLQFTFSCRFNKGICKSALRYIVTPEASLSKINEHHVIQDHNKSVNVYHNL